MSRVVAQQFMITPDNYTPAEPPAGPVNSVNRDGMEDIFSTLLVLALTGNNNIIPYSSDLPMSQSGSKVAVVMNPVTDALSSSVAVIQQSDETSSTTLPCELYAGLSSEVTSPLSDEISSIIPHSEFRTPNSTGVSVPLSDDMSCITPHSAPRTPHLDDNHQPVAGHVEQQSEAVTPIIPQLALNAKHPPGFKVPQSHNVVYTISDSTSDSRQLPGFAVLQSEDTIPVISSHLFQISHGYDGYQDDLPLSDNKDGRQWIAGHDIVTSLIKDSAHIDKGSELQHIPKAVNQDGIIQQLSQRLIHASHIGAHTVKIRLKPEELGELQMDISVIDKSIKAVIIVENYSVKEIIEANLGRLEDALKNHGFKIEQFTVDMRGGDMRDRFTPSLFYGEDAGTRRWGSKVTVNDRVEKLDKDIVVPLDSGLISVFA